MAGRIKIISIERTNHFREKKMKLAKIFAVFFTVIFMQGLKAQIPETISFQGILTDTLGVAKPDGVYLLTFRLYASDEGGAPLWSEQNSIEVDKGLFSHNLGSINSFFPDLKFDQPYWLTLEVSGESELMPRIPLNSSAYSFSSIRSQISDTAYVAHRSDTALVAITTISDTLWQTSGSNIYRLNGNVGIGRFPSFKLDVDGTTRTSDIQITNNAASGRIFTSFNNSGLGMWSDDIRILNQNVGIGTVNPSNKLDVNGTTRTSNIIITNNSATGRILTSSNSSGAGIWSDAIDVTGTIKGNRLQMTQLGGTGRIMYSSNSDGLASWSSDVKIQGGELGIRLGEQAPNAPLHVAQNLSGFNPVASRTAIIESNGLVSLALRTSSTSTTGTHAIYFERPVGEPGGIILLDEGILRFGRYTFTGINTTSSSYRLNIDLPTGNIGIARDPVTNRLEVGGNASKSTAGDWLANSDRRIKTDIKEIDNSKELLMKLHPVKFRYSNEWQRRNPDIKDHYYYNFIAQEYKETFPNSVQGSGEFLKDDPEEILQIDTYNAQIITIKVAQELVKENEKLRE
jgi:hypothetical protein